MRKKNLVVLGMVAMMGMSLVGCGSKKEEATTEAPTTEVTTEAVATDTEATTEEVTTEAEVAKTYVEENGISFTTETSFDSKSLQGYGGSDESPVYDVTTSSKLTQTVDAITTENFTDENGVEMIKYTIPISQSKEIQFTIDDKVNALSSDFIIFDTYTGKTIPTEALTGNDSFSFSTDIEVDGKTYAVSVDCISDGSQNMDWDTLLYTKAGVTTYTITAPAEYDGLAMYINTETPEDAVTYFANDNAPSRDLLEDIASRGYTVDGCKFIKVSDILK